jgi:hypothetical protein
MIPQHHIFSWSSRGYPSIISNTRGILKVTTCSPLLQRLLLKEVICHNSTTCIICLAVHHQTLIVKKLGIVVEVNSSGTRQLVTLII